jgi:hypothetical protein
MFKRAILCSAVAIGMSTTVALAQSEAGLQEYIQACASCHGLAGHGDGPLAEYMTVEVPDITQISISNNGEFPMYQVIGIIDGRTDVRAHGSSMPVWGNRYMTEIAPETGEHAAELLVRGRILALATHLEAIQE